MGRRVVSLVESAVCRLCRPHPMVTAALSASEARASNEGIVVADAQELVQAALTTVVWSHVADCKDLIHAHEAADAGSCAGPSEAANGAIRGRVQLVLNNPPHQTIR